MRNKRWLAGGALGATFCLCPPTFAQESAAYEEATVDSEEEEPAPKINLVPSPLPSRRGRQYKRHRGFYLGLRAGPGWQLTNLVNDEDLRLRAHGPSLSLDAMLGGSVSKGLTFGGGVFGEMLLTRRFRGEGASPVNSNVLLGVVGPFVDAFPSPRGPLHLGAAVGPIGVRVSNMPGDEKSKAMGLGFAGWIGYARWVSGEVSMGASLRLLGGLTGITQTQSVNLMWETIYF